MILEKNKQFCIVCDLSGNNPQWLFSRHRWASWVNGSLPEKTEQRSCPLLYLCRLWKVSCRLCTWASWTMALRGWEAWCEALATSIVNEHVQGQWQGAYLRREAAFSIFAVFSLSIYSTVYLSIPPFPVLPPTFARQVMSVVGLNAVCSCGCAPCVGIG